MTHIPKLKKAGQSQLWIDPEFKGNQRSSRYDGGRTNGVIEVDGRVTQPFDQKQMGFSADEVVFRKVQNGSKPVFYVNPNLNKGANQSRTKVVPAHMKMQMSHQIDKTYLMRNFPLSYFENIDLLFNLASKGRKTNTKSCKILNRNGTAARNIKVQREKEAIQDNWVNSGKGLSAGKENQRVVSSEKPFRRILASENQGIFNCSNKQTESINRLSCKGKQSEKKVGKVKSERVVVQMPNVDNFYHPIEGSRSGSDSRETLYPKYYARGVRQGENVRSANTKYQKGHQGDREEIVNVIASSGTPKINIDKTSSKLNKKRLPNVKDAGRKIFPRKNGSEDVKETNLQQTVNLIDLELSLLNTDELKPIQSISPSVKQSEIDSNSRRQMTKQRIMKSAIQCNKKVQKGKLNFIVQKSQEDEPLGNNQEKQEDDVKTVKMGQQDDEKEIKVIHKKSMLSTPGISFKKKKEIKDSINKENSPIRSDIKNKKSIAMKSQDQSPKIEVNINRVQKKVPSGSKPNFIKGKKIELNREKEEKTKFHRRIKKTGNNKNSNTDKSNDNEGMNKKQSNKKIADEVNCVDLCVVENQGSIQAWYQVKDEKSKSIYEEIMMKQNSGLSAHSNNKNDHLSANYQQNIENRQEPTTFLTDMKKKSWIKDQLEESQEQNDDDIQLKKQIPKVISYQTSLNQKLVLEAKKLKASNLSPTMEVGSQEIDNFCQEMMDLQEQNEKLQRMRQFKEMQRLLATNSKDSNETVIRQLQQFDNVIDGEQKRVKEETNPLATQKNIQPVVLAYTESAEVIYSNAMIKQQSNVKPKTNGRGSQVSIFSRSSDAGKLVVEERSNPKGKNRKRHTTIAENADEDLLQSYTGNPIRFNKNVQKKEGEKQIDQGILDSSDCESSSEDLDYEEHQNLCQSSVFINVDVNKINVEKDVKPMEKKVSDPSFLDMNSQEQALMEGQMMNKIDQIIVPKLKNKNTKKHRATIVKVVQSEQHNIEDKKIDEDFRSTEKEGIQTNKVIVTQRGSQMLTGGNGSQHQFGEMNHMTRSRSMKHITMNSSGEMMGSRKIGGNNIMKGSNGIKKDQTIQQLKEENKQNGRQIVQKVQQKIVNEEEQMIIVPITHSKEERKSASNIKLHKMFDINIVSSSAKGVSGEGQTKIQQKEKNVDQKVDMVKLREQQIKRWENQMTQELINKQVCQEYKVTDVESCLNKTGKVKKCVKQVVCNIQVQYFDFDENSEKLIRSDNKIQEKPVQKNMQSIQQKHEQQEINQKQQIIEEALMKDEQLQVGFDIKEESSIHAYLIDKIDAEMNTVDFLCQTDNNIDCNDKEKSQIAEISQYCQIFSHKINQLNQTNFELDQKCWSIVSKVLRFVSDGNQYFKRLIDSESVWLYTDKNSHTFERYSKPSNVDGQVNIVKEAVRLFFGSKCQMTQIKKNGISTDDKMVKEYLQLILGAPVLLVKETCFNKLDNLYRHSNIFGFAYGRRQVWRIMGVIENRKKQKCVKVQKLNSRETMELTWAKFQEEFRCAFISCFNSVYYSRGVNLPVKGDKKGEILTIKLNIDDEQKSSKAHCVLGCDFGEQKSSGGKMMVYVKGKIQKQRQQHYKYLGSGDLSLISMKLKPGRYMVVLQPLQTQNREGQLMMSCSKETVSISLEGSWHSKEKMLS